MNQVVPSGGDFTTNWLAMMVDAPGLLSTITVVPRAGPSLSAMVRASRSLVAPGGKPITILSGRWGKACAHPAFGSAARPLAAAVAAQAETTRKLKLGAKLPDADPLITSSGDLGSVK